MTKFYDASNPLPAAGTNARLELAANDTVFINLAVVNSSGLAVQATDPASIQIGGDGVLRGSNALEIVAVGTGNAYSVFNEGSISAMSGYGIKVTENGTTDSGALTLFNTGSIFATGLAVTGGSEADHILNKGVVISASLDAINLGKGADTYDGTQGSISGRILLGEGNDTAYGGTGSDHFVGGLGDDRMDGGAGIDTADYSDAISSVFVNLATTGWQSTGGAGMDYLVSIEDLIGSSNNDYLTGSSGDNVLSGGNGGDSLEGAAGNDVLDGGAGTDDWAFYTGSGAAYIDLTIAGPQNTIGYGYDTVTGIENLSGGSGADSFIGDANANKFSGNSGNDTLRGGKGNDTLDGGIGSNTAIFFGMASEYTFPGVLSVADATFSVGDNVANRDGTDELKNIRFLKFMNGTDDTNDDVVVTLFNQYPTSVNLSGTTIKENSEVGATVGTLTGSDPDGDTLTYTLTDNAGGRFKLSDDGRKILVANKGLLDYETVEGSGGYYTIKIKASDGYGGVKEQTVNITITNDMTETAPVNRHGTNAGEQVIGEFGNDLVHGLGGNDSVFGRSGNDKLWGDDGNDYVIGGDGTEGANLSGTGHDTLYGGNGNDSMFGGDGNDFLYGENNNDLLNGNVGNDILYGGNGNDTLYGGSGNDSFVFDVKPNTRSNLDFIADFNPKDDTIKLSHAIFTKIAKGTLSSSAFVVGNAFKDANDRILYLKAQGALFYDPDGSGKAAAIQIANIAKNLNLTNKDFVIF